jgi:hypothetical protein
LKKLERAKGIEPSYSAWKSGAIFTVFMRRSDKIGLCGLLKQLQKFALSESAETTLGGADASGVLVNSTIACAIRDTCSSVLEWNSGSEFADPFSSLPLGHR